MSSLSRTLSKRGTETFLALSILPIVYETTLRSAFAARCSFAP